MGRSRTVATVAKITQRVGRQPDSCNSRVPGGLCRGGGSFGSGDRGLGGGDLRALVALGVFLLRRAAEPERLDHLVRKQSGEKRLK